MPDIQVIQIIISIVGFCGLGYWIYRWIVALKGAVDAQRDTIQAQAQTVASFKSLLDSMRQVLDSTDKTKMLARIDAYKKIVDREKEITIQAVEMELQHKDQQFQKIGIETAKALAPIIGALTQFAGETISYIPSNLRSPIIKSTKLPLELKDAFQTLADNAPDYSTFPGSLIHALTIKESVATQDSVDVELSTPKSSTS